MSRFEQPETYRHDIKAPVRAMRVILRPWPTTPAWVDCSPLAPLAQSARMELTGYFCAHAQRTYPQGQDCSCHLLQFFVLAGITKTICELGTYESASLSMRTPRYQTTMAEIFMFPAIRLWLSRLQLAATAVTLSSGIAPPPVARPIVGNFADNTVSVIETAAATVIATIPVVAGPHGMVITRDGRTAYVTGDGSSALRVINTSTDRVIRMIDVGKTLNGVALTPNGRLLLVAAYGEDRIAFFDSATQSVVATMVVPKPHAIAIHLDGKLA